MIEIEVVKRKDGTLSPADIASQVLLDKLPGTAFKAKLTPIKELRTLNQNAYYFGVHVPMIHARLDELGYRKSDLLDEAAASKLLKSDVHEFLKQTFNRVDVVNPETSEIIGHTSKSTTKLSTQEFSQFLDVIVQWAAENLDIEIPQADPGYNM